MPARTADQIAAQALGELHLANIRLLAQIEELREERDQLRERVSELEVRLVEGKDKPVDAPMPREV